MSSYSMNLLSLADSLTCAADMVSTALKEQTPYGCYLSHRAMVARLRVPPPLPRLLSPQTLAELDLASPDINDALAVPTFRVRPEPLVSAISGIKLSNSRAIVAGGAPSEFQVFLNALTARRRRWDDLCGALGRAKTFTRTANFVARRSNRKSRCEGCLCSSRHVFSATRVKGRPPPKPQRTFSSAPSRTGRTCGVARANSRGVSAGGSPQAERKRFEICQGGGGGGGRWPLA
jgi:hypothetical protein